ncbi:hypothetical protein CASFOL_012996 [Castilleja foliolosa]|uniref:PARG catalytic Macro domain-containing protein n=1 Tax=Castilleja foliolosa TaxID=1961234 RepID=A0ABD3DKJ5_9LAMI
MSAPVSTLPAPLPTFVALLDFALSIPTHRPLPVLRQCSMSKDEAEKWFIEVVPRLADLVLSLPALLEDHYKNAGETGLRLLKSQQSGMVVLSQELIAALLSCALFCMFPTTTRGDNYLPPINFDYLFGVHSSGVIEDQSTELLEVDFADRYLGGLVLQLGTLQEEIRFSINPELIIGTLFLPVMADNESIEMVDAERFSNYTGYDLTFRFSGDHKDNKCLDSMGRRRTRVIAIDALEQPGSTQYKPESLVREANKAFCGFRLNPNVEDEMGVATGNWGCGVFGGDVEVKVVIQWLAASEAKRAFVLYYTFGLEVLEKLGPFVEWVEARK